MKKLIVVKLLTAWKANSCFGSRDKNFFTIFFLHVERNSKTSNKFLVRTLDDLPEKFCKDLARIAKIREELQESCKTGLILKVQKNLASFLKYLARKRLICITDIFCTKNEKIRSFLQESCKILQEINHL